MDKKEALQDIIYNLKEIEGTRIRLSSTKSEVVDLEIALLNQQVVNLYQRLQNYQSGLYASRQSETPVRKEAPVVEYHIKEEAPQVSKPEPVIITRPEPKKEPEPEIELKRDNKDAQLRKERLKRLEAEAAKAEASRKREIPVPAPKSEEVDFDKLVEEKEEAIDIKRDAAKASGIEIPTQHYQKQSADLTLNEKLQSGKKLPESLNDKLSVGDSKKTLAEKMKLGPITDLKSAMALNQKIAFTNGLFKGDDKEFKKALNFLSNCRNFSEAKIYLQTEIGKINSWDENDPLVEEFTELVYRKFL